MYQILRTRGHHEGANPLHSQEMKNTTVIQPAMSGDIPRQQGPISTSVESYLQIPLLTTLFSLFALLMSSINPPGDTDSGKTNASEVPPVFPTLNVAKRVPRADYFVI